MKKVLLFCTLFFSQLAFAGATPDEIIAHYAGEGFSGHILIEQGGEVLRDQRLGKASWRDNIPFAPAAPFYIGSVTKQMTAAAILKLQERGGLNVHDKVATYLPTAPHANEVTLHQLLTHTSGLKNYTDLPEVLAMMTTGASISTDDILALVAPFPLAFSPGSEWSYCNTGYVMLGLIIEKVSGKSLNEFWQHEFFQPAGMTHAAYTPDVRPVDEPQGHAWNRDYENVPQANGHMSWAHAAGGVYATAYDMMKWSKALHGGAFLSSDSYTAMITPALEDYGYGVMVQSIDELGGKKLIGHSGGMPGFTCQIVAIPELDLHVIVLTNISGANSMASAVSSRLLKAYAGLDVSLPAPIQEVPLSSDDASLFAGEYMIGELEMKVAVFVENGRIYLQPEGQEPVRLLFADNDTFYLRIEDISVKFTRSADNTIDGFILNQRGYDFVAARVQGGT